MSCSETFSDFKQDSHGIKFRGDVAAVQCKLVEKKKQIYKAWVRGKSEFRI
jgi:hypothetical protein